MRDAEQYDYGFDSDIEEEEVKEKEKPNPKSKSKQKPKGKEQGAPSQPPPYRYSQSHYPDATPSEFDVSDTTSDSSGLSSDDEGEFVSFSPRLG
jgi:hypothetical protein